jgi:hypothetical protein
VPTLDLRFADNKSLTDAVTGASLVTFTRASDGTFVDSAGVIQTAATDVPRFDHNPTTGESLGLLVEEQRTNLLLRSEEFETSWTASEATVTANQIDAPNGTTTADLYTTSGSTGVEHYVTQVFTAASSTNYTASVYVKAGTGSAFGLQYRVAGAWVGGNVLTSFNLSTQVATIDSGTATASITPVGNGWFRCRITATSSVAGGSPQFRIATGDGSGTIYAWGAQLEAGAFPTSYIPTTTAAVTRSADVASIGSSAFSSWYRQDEGTVFGSYKGIANIEGGGTRRLIEIGVSGAATNRMILGYNSTAAGRFLVVASASTQADQSASATQGSQVSNAASYKTDDFIIASNSVLSAGDTSGAVPSVSAMAIGNDFTSGSASSLNGTIRRLCYWNQRLANSTLQALSQ